MARISGKIMVYLDPARVEAEVVAAEAEDFRNMGIRDFLERMRNERRDKAKVAKTH